MAGTYPKPIGYASFYQKCAPRVAQDIERCPNATACDIAFITPDELESIYTKDNGTDLNWRVDAALIEADFMGKVCQVRTNGMYDWIRASARQWSRSQQGSRARRDGRYEYQPFIKMERNGLINNEFWSSEYQSTPAATKITNESGEEVLNTQVYVYRLSSQGSIPNSVEFFPKNMRIFMSSKDKTNSQWSITQFKVHTAVQVDPATAPNAIDVTVFKADTTSNSNLPGAGKIPGVDGNLSNFGVVTRGTKNVSDYDQDCQVVPGLNTKREAYFWIESTRVSTCDNEMTKKFMNLVKEGNPLYRKFYHVEENEWNRQVMEDYQRRMAWSWWFGSPSSANQTETAWPNLPKVLIPTPSDIGNYFAGECTGYRADAVGMIPQAIECDRVTDYKGAQLSLPVLFQDIYDICRIREENGVDSRVIELHTSNFLSNQIAQGLLRYYSMRSEGLLRLNENLSSSYAQGPFGFSYRRFVLDYPDGVELRLVTHKFYDDWVTAHNSASTELSGTGNLAIIPDFSSMYMANVDSNSVRNQTGNAQDLAVVSPDMACVMKTPRMAWNHRSSTHTFVNECPDSMLVMTNFACDVPLHQADTCP